MKLVVLGDLHLGGGYSLGRIDPYRQLNSRLIDHSDTFDHVVDFMVEHEVEHLALTGDIYEHRRPEASQMAVFSEKLAHLSDLGIHTHIVAGNHDIVRAHKATTMDKFRLLKLPFVHVYNDIGTYCCPSMNLVFLPFRTKQMLQCWSNEEAVTFLRKSLEYEIQSLDNDNPTVLIGHMTLQGACGHGSPMEDHAVFDIIMPFSTFEGFDAVVMGHIHQFQVLSTEPLIMHVGSMERTDFGESKQPKFFTLFETEGDTLKWDFVSLPVKPLHDLVIDKSLEGPEGLMKSIKKWLQDYGSKNIMGNGIVRVEIMVGEHAAQALDTSEILRFILRDMAVSHCVGVHSTVITRRQLRDSTITERADPHSALTKWLDANVQDQELREGMRKAGFKIMEGN